MAAIDIRTEDDAEIDTIKFADFTDSDIDDRTDIGSDIRYDAYEHSKFIFLHVDDSEYTAIRKCDIPNLIKALEKSLEIWKD